MMGPHIGAAARELLERIDPEHTGVAASWCPICGDCTCPRWSDGHWIDDPEAIEVAYERRGACPLHSKGRPHGRADRTGGRA